MAINTAASVAAYKQYKQDLASAVSYSDRDLTHSAVTRRRAQRVEAARKALQAHTPAAPDPVTLEDRRPAVLAALRPTTADQVAVLQHEWATVEAALRSGRPIQQVLLEATTTQRVAAILANLEAWSYSQDTTDPAGVVADLESMAFDRLVEQGYEPAVSANTVAEAFQATAAWNRVLSESLTGEVTLGALTDLHRWDADGYRQLAEINAEVDPAGDVAKAVARLDAVIASGELPQSEAGA